MKVPYEIITLEVDKLITSMALSYNIPNNYWQYYLQYISACGWTDFEYDQETIRRIDLTWDDSYLFWN
jgi:hypothetical protein